MRLAINYYYSNLLKCEVESFRKKRDNTQSENSSLSYNILRYIKSL